MAQKLKFGNGTWATKQGSTLAYNDENSNFKPLPFTTTRASSATRVNKEGLIEVVGKDIPRIDYTDSADGVLLLENSATNYSVYSESPSNWTYTEFGSGSTGTITTGKTDMFGGTNAVQIDFPANADNVGVNFGSSSSGLTSGNCSISIYVKLVEEGSKDIQLRAGANLTSIENINSTEFKRIDLSGTKTISEAFNLKLRPSVGTSVGGFSIIVCHPQEENSSHATSYIPTSGSTVQRAAETANGAGNSEVFNDSEGVLFANISALANDGTFRTISLNSGSPLQSIRIFYRNDINKIQFYLQTNNESSYQGSVSNATDFNKLAIKYKENDTDIYINGFLVHTMTSVAMPIGLSQLDFYNNNTQFFYGKTKELGYYDTTLTDEELEYMTSYRSLSELVTELNLNTL